MSAWVTKGVGEITQFVDDLAATKAFYADVFRLPVVHEDDVSVWFDFGNTLINLLTTSAASELIDPATPGGHDAGPRVQLTETVADVDGVAAEPTARGVDLLNGPMDRPWDLGDRAVTGGPGQRGDHAGGRSSAARSQRAAAAAAS